VRVAFQAALLGLALAAALPAPARAEKADRDKPMTVEADRDGTIDTRLGVTVFSGNAVISQGTMIIRAERVEVRDPPTGPRTAVATGTPGRPASFRQKREGVDEHVEAQAERIEYDGAADTLRFSGNAVLRRLRAGSVVDEAQGALIVWDNRSESLSMRGGTVTPVNPGGRVRVTLGPAKPASAPTSSASPPASPPTTPPRPEAVPLKPSRTLGEPR
jgi:lipopolysaccharide export system protein LptA